MLCFSAIIKEQNKMSDILILCFNQPMADFVQHKPINRNSNKYITFHFPLIRIKRILFHIEIDLIWNYE